MSEEQQSSIEYLGWAKNTKSGKGIIYKLNAQCVATLAKRLSEGESYLHILITPRFKPGKYGETHTCSLLPKPMPPIREQSTNTYTPPADVIDTNATEQSASHRFATSEAPVENDEDAPF